MPVLSYILLQQLYEIGECHIDILIYNYAAGLSHCSRHVRKAPLSSAACWLRARNDSATGGSGVPCHASFHARVAAVNI